MTIVNWHSFKKSFRYAASGIRYAYEHEQNFRIQIVAAVIVLFLSYAVRISTRDFIIVLLLIGGVMVMELINTVLELFTNAIEPKIAMYAKIMKDVMAGAVFLMSLIALVVGTLIFLPYF